MAQPNNETPPTNPDVAQLSFERAIDELETIVKRLEDGKVPLEESVAIYERGEALKRRCEELLRPGRSARRKNHPRRHRPPHRQRAAGRRVIAFSRRNCVRVLPTKANANGE